MAPCLPFELLSHIFTFLAASTRDLAAVARVHSAWANPARRRLYLRVDHRPLTTLATSPSIARLVRSFALHLPHPLLHAALPNMALLVELDLFLTDPHVLPLHPAFPRLQRFATSLPWSPPLLLFLHNSPAISQLYLDSPAPFDDLPIPPSFLPALSHFTGPPALALLLIPHRPVQHIDLTSTPQSQGLTPSLALSLSQSSAPVLALAATTSSTGDENLLAVLNILAACMGHLRHLRVVTNTYADAHSSAVFGNAYFENIADTLASLPDLQSCEIWGFHWVSSKNSIKTDKSSTWHSPSFTNNTTLDDLYQDLIFPY